MTKNMQNLLYPTYLKLTGKRVLVVGGGFVAYQKLLGLVNTDCKITVIAPQIIDEVYELDGSFPYKRNIHFIERDYQFEDEKGCFMVIAATDIAELNTSITNRCHDQGILACCVDDPGNSDFYIPSIVDTGAIKLALSTDGQAPSLAQRLRRDLEPAVRERYEPLVRMISDFRQKVRDKYPDISHSKYRMKLMRWFADRLFKNQGELLDV